MAGEHVYTAVEARLASVADGEFVAIVGPDRLRQIDPAQRRRRLASRRHRAGVDFRRPLSGLNGQAGYLFQADALFPVEDRDRQCRDRARNRGHGVATRA
jgi:NitT/TauT family transport system ATP-binding protein